jgi:glycosyltransferase involved in cell wall biosynthesis
MRPKSDGRPIILFNASHSIAGGGLIYFERILPELAKATDFQWIVVAPREILSRVNVPKEWAQWISPPRGLLMHHMWEQIALPLKAWRARTSITLCNASYVPLFAPYPIPIVHSPVKDGLRQARSWKEWFYWKSLYVLTSLSLWRSPFAFTTARHLLDDYKAGRGLLARGRTAWTPPGTPEPEADVQKDPNLIIAVGDIYAHKDYEAVIRAMAEIVRMRGQTRLEIMGKPWDVAYADKLSRLIAQLNLEDSVFFLGFLPHKQAMRRLAEASVLVSASLAETSNMVVIEAMAVGTPVVLSDELFHRSIANGAAHFIRSGDSKHLQFAVTLIDVLNHQDRQEQMQFAGRRLAARYKWRSSAETILEALRASARRSPAQTRA